MPGSGKSTLWRLLSNKIWFSFLDFDDDIIEPSQWKTVWEIAENSSWDDFLKLEEDLCLALSFSQTVFASSWSLPYSPKSVRHLKSLWTIVYLKVDVMEIQSRISHMKTDRIIGMKDNNLSNLLKEREKLYSESADIVFEYSWEDTDTIVCSLIKQLWKK